MLYQYQTILNTTEHYNCHNTFCLCNMYLYKLNLIYPCQLGVNTLMCMVCMNYIAKISS